MFSGVQIDFDDDLDVRFKKFIKSFSGGEFNYPITLCLRVCVLALRFGT